MIKEIVAFRFAKAALGDAAFAERRATLINSQRSSESVDCLEPNVFELGKHRIARVQLQGDYAFG
jgi:hypothetical protein